jgi:hypothetical protein
MTAWELPTAADDRHTYFAHALALAAVHGPGPWPDGGYPLPDEDERAFMSGSVQDGVQTHHSSFEVNRSAAASAAAMITAAVEEPPDIIALQALHDFLAEHNALSFADALGTELGVRGPRVRQVGRWLAEYGTRRNAVAAGVVLIGLTGSVDDRELLMLLGALEDLTLYAVVALGRTQDDRDWAVFELARRVRAWGRIHSVERLKDTTDPRIKAWLLRDGFRNGIMDEYLALIAATTGDLAGALQSKVDTELLDAAGGIISALCQADGGPAKGMDHYPDGPAVIDRYLTSVRDQPTLDRVRVVLTINGYLKDDRCQELLTDLDWIEAVQYALDSPDLDVCGRAVWPAQRLRLRFQDKLTGWLERDPDNTYFWQVLENVDELVSLAQRLLPLADLATGPSMDLGLGTAFAADSALDTVVGRLEKHPGRGWPLVKTALANRTRRNRTMAVRTLNAWPRSPDILAAVQAAAKVEPDDKLRAEMRELLADATQSSHSP